MPPDVSSALGVSISSLFLNPHRCRQDAISRHRSHRWIGIRNHDEVVRIAIAWIGLVRTVQRCLQVVVDLNPVEIEFSVVKHPILLDGMITRLFRDNSGWDPPNFFGTFTMFGIGDHHVSRQSMCKSPHFTSGAAG